MNEIVHSGTDRDRAIRLSDDGRKAFQMLDVECLVTDPARINRPSDGVPKLCRYLSTKDLWDQAPFTEDLWDRAMGKRMMELIRRKSWATISAGEEL